MTDSPLQLAIIGLDGVRLDVIRRFQEDLPFLSGMLDEGASGELETVLPGPHSGPAWTSFSTGVNPGKHGLGDWRVKDGYEFTPATGEDITQYRFWDYLSDAGYTVGVFNIPLTSPPTEVNGVLVTSWTKSIDEYVYPRSFQKKLDAIGYERKADFSSADDPLDNLLDSIETRRQACELFMDEYDWNLLVGMFYETEQAHHQFASFLDPDHEAYDPDYEGHVKQVYQKVDEELAKLSERLGDTPLLIMSDHGFAPVHERIYLNRILETYDYYRPDDFDHDKDPDATSERLFLNLIRSAKSNTAVRKLAKTGARAPIVGKFVDSFISQYQNIEYRKDITASWEDTEAFNGYEHGGIFINTESDHANGIVADSDVNELVDNIIADLDDDEFLTPRVEGIYRREELFDGPNLSKLPEIIVNFADGYLGSSGHDDRLSRGPDELSNIGFHTKYGILLGKGADIARGTFEDAHILDIAPTVMRYFEQPIPSNMDGEPLERVFNSEGRFADLEVGEVEPQYSSEEPRLTDAERQSVEKHLRDMGYK